MSGKGRNKGAQATRRRTSGGFRLPGWLWLLVGIGLGAYGTVMLILDGGMPVPELTRPTVTRPAANPIEKAAPALPPPTKPEYDFYTILPNQEVVISEEEINPAAGADANTASGPWLLQVGSFRNGQDADRVRATLAMQGIESFISIREAEASTWHRVRVGPIHSRREADRIRSKLQRQNFQPMIIKTE